MKRRNPLAEDDNEPLVDDGMAEIDQLFTKLWNRRTHYIDVDGGRHECTLGQRFNRQQDLALKEATDRHQLSFAAAPTIVRLPPPMSEKALAALSRHPDFCNQARYAETGRKFGLDLLNCTDALNAVYLCRPKPKLDYLELRERQNRDWADRTIQSARDQLQKGEVERALKTFQHAIDIDNKNMEAVASIYVNTNRRDEALLAFERALGVEPLCQPVYDAWTRFQTKTFPDGGQAYRQQKKIQDIYDRRAQCQEAERQRRREQEEAERKRRVRNGSRGRRSNSRHGSPVQRSGSHRRQEEAPPRVSYDRGSTGWSGGVSGIHEERGRKRSASRGRKRSGSCSRRSSPSELTKRPRADVPGWQHDEDDRKRYRQERSDREDRRYDNDRRYGNGRGYDNDRRSDDRRHDDRRYNDRYYDNDRRYDDRNYDNRRHDRRDYDQRRDDQGYQDRRYDDRHDRHRRHDELGDRRKEATSDRKDNTDNTQPEPDRNAPPENEANAWSPETKEPEVGGLSPPREDRSATIRRSSSRHDNRKPAGGHDDDHHRRNDIRQGPSRSVSRSRYRDDRRGSMDHHISAPDKSGTTTQWNIDKYIGPRRAPQQKPSSKPPAPLETATTEDGSMISRPSVFQRLGKSNVSPPPRRPSVPEEGEIGWDDPPTAEATASSGKQAPDTTAEDDKRTSQATEDLQAAAMDWDMHPVQEDQQRQRRRDDHDRSDRRHDSYTRDRSGHHRHYSGGSGGHRRR